MSRSNDFVRFTLMAKIVVDATTAILAAFVPRARFQQQEFVHHAFIGDDKRMSSQKIRSPCKHSHP